MNIGIVCYPTYGGSGVVATELAKALSTRGHQVHILSYARPTRLDTLDANISYHEVAVNSYPLFEYPPYDLALASHMVDLIRFQKLDLLHVHYAIPHATSGYLAKQILGQEAAHVPVITTLHGTDITIVGNDPSYKPVVDFSINQSDGVTAVSEYLRNETYANFDIKNEIKVVPNFVDLERFHRQEKSHFKQIICPNDEKIVVHVSNFRKVKRVNDVVEVFAYIIKSGIKAKLVMVGDGPERTNAEQHCRDLGVCGDVRFVGKQEKVEEILSIADLFLMPSGSETFGLAALEAMSCSVPVISTNIGGIPELNIQGETGFLCDVGDTDTMGHHAVAILGNDSLQKTMAHNARKRAEMFEIDNIVSMYEDYYEEVARKTRDKAMKAFV
jgi:N-acetyl-alpha-D-glucosaminyl L-malate synthase BshA